MVNILSKTPFIKELFQQEVTGEAIANEIIKILSDKNYYHSMSENLFSLKEILQTKNSFSTAAEEISEYL